MKTIDYLKATKRTLGIESDYALAKHLGVTKASISLLMNGHGAMSNTTAAKVAEILEIPLQRVIADMELERGSSSPELWKRLRDAAAIAGVGVAAALLAAHFARSSGADIHQVTALLGVAAMPLDALCIMLNTPAGGAAAIVLSTVLLAVLFYRRGPYKPLWLSQRPT